MNSSSKWDDFSEKISDAAGYVCKETEKFGDRAKLRYKLVVAKKKLDEEYTALGKIVYAEMKKSNAAAENGDAEGGNTENDRFSAEAMACTSKIAAIKAEVEQLKAAYEKACNP